MCADGKTGFSVNCVPRVSKLCHKEYSHRYDSYSKNSYRKMIKPPMKYIAFMFLISGCKRVSKTLVWILHSKAPEDQSNGDGSHQSWFIEIGKAKKAKRDALIQSVERLCASQTARSKAVLDRLQDTFPTPQRPASLSPVPESSPKGKKVKHTPNVKDKSSQTQDTKQICYEEDCVFQKTQLSAGQAAAQGGPLPNISGECGDVGETLSPVDAHSPREMRFSTDPLPGPKPRKQSRLPVIIGRAGKIRLWTEDHFLHVRNI